MVVNWRDVCRRWRWALAPATMYRRVAFGDGFAEVVGRMCMNWILDRYG